MLALLASLCTLGSLVTIPAATAASGGTDASDPDTSNCVAASTSDADAHDKFKLEENADGTLTVNGFSDTFLNGHASSACYDLIIGATVSTIGDSAFENKNVRKLTFEEGDVTLTMGSYAFRLTHITTLNLPARFVPESRSSHIFSNIDELRNVAFSSDSQITQLQSSDIFAYSKLDSLVLPPNLNMVSNDALASITITDASKITWPTSSTSLTLYGAFNSSQGSGTSGGHVTFPDNLKSIMLYGVFTSWARMEGMTFPKSMDNLTIYNGFSVACGAQVDVELPETVKTLSITGDAFSSACASDTSGKESQVSIRLPKTVTATAELTETRITSNNDGDNVYVAPEGITANSTDYWSKFTFVGDPANTTIHDANGTPITPNPMNYVQQFTRLTSGGDVQSYAQPITTHADSYTLTVPNYTPTNNLTDEQIADALSGSFLPYNPDYSYTFSFGGWMVSGPFGAEITVDGNTYYGYEAVAPKAKVETDMGGNYTWTAGWIPTAGFTISYTGLPESVKLPAGAPATYDSNNHKFDLPDMSTSGPNGLTFTGWTWTSDFESTNYPKGTFDQTTTTNGAEWPDSGNTRYGVYGNLTLLAHYEGTVTNIEQLDDVTYVEGEEPELPSTVKVTYEGGATRTLPVTWDTTGIDWKSLKAGDTKTLSGTIADVTDQDAAQKATVKVTVASSDVTLTLNPNYDGATATPKTQAVKRGDSVTLDAKAFTRPGYTLTGWTTAKGAGTYYMPGGTVSNLTGNLTLYAQWTKNASGGTTVVNKKLVTITGVTAADAWYDGAAHTGYTGEPTSDFKGTYTVMYTGTGATKYGPSAEAPKAAGTYRVTISVPSTDSTWYGSLAMDFSIRSGSTVVGRFYTGAQGAQGLHMWTTSDVESAALGASGWNREGDAFTMDAHVGTPVYRLYDPRGNQHLWTVSVEERDHLAGEAGWNDEGVAFYENPTVSVPVYRLYNPWTGEHLWTTSLLERDSLASLPANPWTFEGVAFNALS